MSVTASSPREHLECIFRRIIAAIQPGDAVRVAMEMELSRLRTPVHLVALGKAARVMLRATAAWCDEHAITMAGGVCISHERDDVALPEGIIGTHGDHPQAGDASSAAAEVLRAYVTQRVQPGATVVVLLSGGTSALIGAPAGALPANTYRACCDLLLRSGLDIHAHNVIRRQLSTWGNGRLGAALHAAGAAVNVLAISDVPGDAPVSIGSAPCIATPVDERENEAMLQSAVALTDDERAVLRDALAPANALSTRLCPAIPHRIVSSNRLARDAVAAAAGATMHTIIAEELLAGDAYRCGDTIARQLVHARATLTAPALYCWGGEPVVSLPANAPPGGRMQALALAAARTLHEAGAQASQGITILAAGSDGRDGVTRAAGAVVDGATWSAMQRVGIDAAAMLAAHDSHTALRSVDCLIPLFVSGTNVNDLVIALVEPAT